MFNSNSNFKIAINQYSKTVLQCFQQRRPTFFWSDSISQIKHVIILVETFWDHQEGTSTCIDFFKYKIILFGKSCHVEPKCSWLKHWQGSKMHANWSWNDVGRKPTMIPHSFSVHTKSPTHSFWLPKVKFLLLDNVHWFKGLFWRASTCASQMRPKIAFWYVACCPRCPTIRDARNDLKHLCFNSWAMLFSKQNIMFNQYLKNQKMK